MDILIAMAILSITLTSAIILFSSLQDIVLHTSMKIQADQLAKAMLIEAKTKAFTDLQSYEIDEEGFHKKFIVSYATQLTVEIEAEVSWGNKTTREKTTFSDTLVDWENASQVSSCAYLENGGNLLTQVISDQVDVDPLNMITDSVLYNNILFISTNSATRSVPDLYIIDVHDIQHPKILSSLNTGPGIASIVLHDNYIYAANLGTSQLQVISVSDLLHPVLVVQVRLPGVTVSNGGGIGRSIYYSQQNIFIGLTKAIGPEFHILDVNDPLNPIEKGSYEAGSEVNKIMIAGTQAFIATPLQKQISILDISNSKDITEQQSITLNGWQTLVPNAFFLLGRELFLGRTVGGFNTQYEEFFSFDLSLNSISTVIHQDIAASIDDMVVAHNRLYLATNDGQKEFQVYSLYPFALLSHIDLSSRALRISCKDQNIIITTESPTNIIHIYNYAF